MFIPHMIQSMPNYYVKQYGTEVFLDSVYYHFEWHIVVDWPSCMCYAGERMI